MQRKNYKFLMKENIVFVRFDKKFFNKICIVLPQFVAEFVLRHFHIEKKMHISAKQLGCLFGQSFFSFGWGELCQKITGECLHCITHYYKNKQNKALGEERLFDDIITPNVVWSWDVMYLPASGGFTHLLLGVEMISSYVVLYPLRANTADEVVKILKTHLSLFPHFSVAKSDFGSEMSQKVTEFLPLHSIHHYLSIPVISQSNGQAEIAIKIIRTLINRIVDSSGLQRNQWHNMIPFITNCINQTHLSSAQGLSRTQLLFSPYLQISGLPAEDLFLVQEKKYKKILTNRQ